MTSPRTLQSNRGDFSRFPIMKMGGKWSHKLVQPKYFFNLSKIVYFNFLSYNGGENTVSHKTPTPLSLDSFSDFSDLVGTELTLNDIKIKCFLY